MFTFSKLIAPLSQEDFFEQYWLQKPLHIARNQLSFYEHVFTLNHLKRLLVDLPLTIADPLKLIKEGYSLPLSFLVKKDQLIEQEELWKYYFSGYTIVFDKIIDYFPQLMEPCKALYDLLCRQSGQSFSQVDMNAYLTPRGNHQGLYPHFDNHPVFVLQIEGRKMWRVYAHKDIFMSKSKGQEGQDLRKFLGEPLIDIELHPGDLLYLPEGYFHEACSCESDFSFHLSLAVMISSAKEQQGFNLLTQIYEKFPVTAFELDKI